MMDELEFRLRRLQLHAPSADLDGRIAKVLHRAPLVGAPISASSWSTWAVTSTVLLLVGFGLGWAVASSLQTSPTNSLAPTVDRRPPALASTPDTVVSSSSGLANASTSRRNTTVARKGDQALAQWLRTDILAQPRMGTADGRVVRGYVTRTRQRVRMVDPTNQIVREMEVSIPKIVIAPPESI